VLFASAGQMLGDLASLDSDSALRRRLHHYARPRLLVLDEVGYLSYSNRHADLLFELVSRRYEHKSTVVTTNRPFAEWREVFPNATFPDPASSPRDLRCRNRKQGRFICSAAVASGMEARPSR
jgi:DNA replication protein DnaC